ncbi:ABC-type Fe3+-siderophore transport system permease subunit [Sporosarcina luteola]|nr:ABC-type Fe3+-siderophore transport system permease subunit [Sporosarcina luteola]
MKKSLQLIGIGTFAGLVLSCFFYVIERTTGNKVYTLLLNVDYIPVFRNYTYSEPVELLFHIIISVLLVYSLYLMIQIWKIKRIIAVCILINFLLGAILYPTTGFSTRTPPIESLSAIGYWLAGHLLYGLILGLLFKLVLRTREKRRGSDL